MPKNKGTGRVQPMLDKAVCIMAMRDLFITRMDLIAAVKDSV